MPEISLQSIPVMIDGGSHEGRLVLSNGHLAAVLTHVPPKETVGEQGRAGGWFLEAGFGPCGGMMTLRPEVFASLEEAVEWVRGRLEAEFPLA